MSTTVNRRSFYKVAGAGLATALAVTKVSAGAGTRGAHIDLGSGDLGLLSYAYLLEQLEAAFYTQVLNSPYKDMTPTERSFLTDIRNDEIGHREWFSRVLSANKVTDFKAEFDFSFVD